MDEPIEPATVVLAELGALRQMFVMFASLFPDQAAQVEERMRTTAEAAYGLPASECSAAIARVCSDAQLQLAAQLEQWIGLRRSCANGATSPTDGSPRPSRP